MASAINETRRPTGVIAACIKADTKPATISDLAEIDWDFPERVSAGGIESVHPYPAKFITEIPRALLNALPIPSGTAVLDPFCGGGTTLVECQRKGLPSFGIDLNPIACLMARVKTAPHPAGLAEAASTAIRNAQGAVSVEIPSLPNIDHWFDQPVQHALAALAKAVDGAASAFRDALRMALSSIIVRVSHQESDTRYAAIDKNITQDDVYALFRRAVLRLDAVLAERDYRLAPARVFNADTLTFDASRIGVGVGMVITSPPYPNAYEYWLYHKYRMYWLGYDPLAVKAREIGARAHFFKRNPHTRENFVRQMAGTFDLIRAVLVPGGYACFVVGRSRIHGQVIDNARIVEEAAEGFDLVFTTERSISAKRKSFNLSHANIKTESLLVLKRRTANCS